MNIKTVVLKNDLPKITAQMAPYARLVVLKTTLDIERESKQSMSGPKHGREYPSKNRKMHQASAPGEAPAIDTGVLVNSIQSQMTGPMTGIVFTNTEYAPILEFGSVHMAPRPFFLPAAKQAWPSFLEAMKRIVNG